VSHKFKIGQLVHYLGRDGAPGVYQVTQLLPQAEDEVSQYRIKSVKPQERVAREHELRRAAGAEPDEALACCVAARRIDHTATSEAKPIL
jgi:hypothetical protein